MATIKQKLAVKKILENPSWPVSRAMKEVRYSPNTIVDPGNLTRSNGWHKLMDKHLPDEKLLSVHERALDATKTCGSLTESGREVPDIPTQLKAVELAYKVKKKLSPETMNTFNTENMVLEFTKNEK